MQNTQCRSKDGFRKQKDSTEKLWGRVCTWHTLQGRVFKVALRTSTSILLVSVLVAGILSPSGLCILMCRHQFRAESKRPCAHPQDPMPGMMHYRSSATTHPDRDTVTARCSSNCDEVERLNLPRKPTGQVTPQRAGIRDLDKLNRVAAPETARAFVVYGGPPDRYNTGPAFSVLRI